MAEKTVAQWTSEVMKVTVEPPLNRSVKKVEYPYELFSGTLIEEGTGNTEGYLLEA